MSGVGQLAEAVQCEVCGHPTRCKYRVCYSRTPDCAREYKRRERLAHVETRRAREREWYLSNRERHAATRAAWHEANLERMREYHRDYNITWKKQNPDAVKAYDRKHASSPRRRETRRAHLQRTDRPCRNAPVGCTEFAAPGSRFCRVHENADAMRRYERRRRRLSRKLASVQGDRCTWCDKPLPEDLGDTHIDHVIPRACRGPDLEWNLELLHAACNLTKNDKITPHAVALAVAHGVVIQARRSGRLSP